jgi:hypothetical protein
MFDGMLSEEYLESYQKSQHRDRIDLLTGTLARLKYLEEVIVEHVHEWTLFTQYCGDLCIDVPSTIYAQEVGDYLR